MSEYRLSEATRRWFAAALAGCLSLALALMSLVAAAPADSAPGSPVAALSATAGLIYGQVMNNEAAAAGVSVTLRRYSVFDGSNVAVLTTTTNVSGTYQFADPPTPPEDWVYYVRFGPQTTNAAYVWQWVGPQLPEYQQGQTRHGGDLNIADIPLLTPPDGATVAVPAVLRWARRSTADNYFVMLYDPTTGTRCLTSPNCLESFPLGYADSYTVTVDLFTDGVLEYGMPYRWSVGALGSTGPDDPFTPGFNVGYAFYERTITFSPPLTPTITTTPTPTRTGTIIPPATGTPTLTPTVTPVVAGAIYGQVMDNEAAAAGVSVTLRRYSVFDGSNVAVLTTTTNMSGTYQFNDPSTPPDDWVYYVRFGPQTTNAAYVWQWVGPQLPEYQQGQTRHGGDLNIADIPLLTPPDGATVAVPAVLRWERRSTADSYFVMLYDPTTGTRCLTSPDCLESFPLGYADSYTVTVDLFTSGALDYGTPYRWSVGAFDSTDPGDPYTSGFNIGYAFHERTVIFTAPVTPTTTATVTLTPIPTATSTGASTVTLTPMSTATATPTHTVSPPATTSTATATRTATPPATGTATPTASATATPTPSPTMTPTPPPSATATPTPPPSMTPTPTATPPPEYRLYIPLLIRGAQLSGSD